MIKKILVFAGIILSFLALSYGFVPQVLQGKIVNQSDISGWQGMSHEMMEWNKSHPDDQTSWTGSMFSGMPTTTIHASQEGDWTQALYDLLLIGKRPATYLFISLLGAFLLLLSLGASPLVAAGGAIAVTFCSYNLQIIQVGHNTKMQALAFMPWVLAGVVFTYRRALESTRWLPITSLGSALFGLALSMQIKANHPQISYYLAMIILVYAIVLLSSLLLSSEKRALLGRFFAASALLLVMGCAGIGTNAIKLVPLSEYTPYSMRGGSTSDPDGSKVSEGLELDYATAWSYGWEELPNLLIPNYNGGSSIGAVNPRYSETCKLLKEAGKKNVRDMSRNMPLYWGPQPFTAGPMYMGAVTIFLFVLGLFHYKDKRIRWWIIIITLLAILLAVGNHFMWFTRLFHSFVPLYNKFRTVSMSLVILQITLPVLGFLMLDSIVKDSISSRQVLAAGAITALACLALALMQSRTGNFVSAADTDRQDAIMQALAIDRFRLLWIDTLRSLLLVTVSCLVLVWGVKPASAKKTPDSTDADTTPDIDESDESAVTLENVIETEALPKDRRMRRTVAAIVVCFLVLADLFDVGKRYLNSRHFVTQQNFLSQFDKRKVDEFILADTDPSFRVLDLTVDVFNDSHPSYWHKNIGGYSPAKLQRYQEFIESQLTDEINSVIKSLEGIATVHEAEAVIPYLSGLASLNCRYIILDADIPPVSYRHARGNAWFEGSEGMVTLTSYAPNELQYDCSSDCGGKVVFSEVYYPIGWKLTMEDGKEIPIGLFEGSEGSDTPGGLFRCADIPAGDHHLVMRFEPASYRRGEALSRACSILLILMVLGSLVLFFPFKKTE